MAPNAIPFRIARQSRSAFPPTNGMGDHPDMDYARQNIDFLRGDMSVNRLALASGVGQSWLQRYLKPENAGGIQKDNTEKLAKLAAYFRVSLSDLMSKDLSSAARPESQLAGLEAQTLHDAVKLLELYEAMLPTPPPRESYSDRLFVALKVVRDEGGTIEGDGLVRASKRLAAELRQATG